MQIGEVDVADALGGITLTVRVHNSKFTRVRLYIGGMIIKFGGWITGFKDTTVVITHE